jgi:hypothetical protein
MQRSGDGGGGSVSPAGARAIRKVVARQRKRQADEQRAKKLVAAYQSHDFGSHYEPASLTSTFTPTAKVAEFLAPAPMGIPAGEWIKHPLRATEQSAGILAHVYRPENLLRVAATVPTEKYAVKTVKTGLRLNRIRKGRADYKRFQAEKAEIQKDNDLLKDFQAYFHQTYPGYDPKTWHTVGHIPKAARANQQYKQLVGAFLVHKRRVEEFNDTWANHPNWANVAENIKARVRWEARARKTTREEIRDQYLKRMDEITHGPRHATPEQPPGRRPIDRSGESVGKGGGKYLPAGTELRHHEDWWLPTFHSKEGDMQTSIQAFPSYGDEKRYQPGYSNYDPKQFPEVYMGPEAVNVKYNPLRERGLSGYFFGRRTRDEALEEGLATGSSGGERLLRRLYDVTGQTPYSANIVGPGQTPPHFPAGATLGMDASGEPWFVRGQGGERRASRLYGPDGPENIFHYDYEGPIGGGGGSDRRLAERSLGQHVNQGWWDYRDLPDAGRTVPFGNYTANLLGAGAAGPSTPAAALGLALLLRNRYEREQNQ